MKILIQLDDYEVANLLHLLNFIPKNGEWRENIINKINYEVDKIPNDNKQFSKNVQPNSGITLEYMKKHIELMAFKEKHRIY